MDVNYYSDIFNNSVNATDCDDRHFTKYHPIKAIMLDNYDYLEELDASGKARPCVLDNISKSILCQTSYLGYDSFECPNCDNFTIVCKSCHSRFCNGCGVKYAKQMATKVTWMCLDVTHRHIVFTIPDTLRNWFRQDRSRLNILFVAARNTICLATNKNALSKIKKGKNIDTHYMLQNHRVKNDFGMIATLHTFGRDLKWNPHIHALVAESVYDIKKDKIKTFNYFNFALLRKTWMYEVLRLICEHLNLKLKDFKKKMYEEHSNGFYVYAKYKKDEDKQYYKKDCSNNINGCISYCMRYAARPAMAESRITKYDSKNNTVSWFYNDHKDEKRYDVTDSAKDFINKLIIHIPDRNFKTVRYYGFYANGYGKVNLDHLHDLLGSQRKRDYSRKTRDKKLKHQLNRYLYRTHMIDSFNRDPIKCSCGHYMEYAESYDPLNGKKITYGYRKKCIDEMRKMRKLRRSPTLDT